MKKNLLEHTIYACTYGRRSLCVWNKKKDEKNDDGRVGWDGPLPSTQGDWTGGCRGELTIYIILYRTTIGDLVDPLEIVKGWVEERKKTNPH